MQSMNMRACCGKVFVIDCFPSSLGEKNDDSTHPNFTPSIFESTSSPKKRAIKTNLSRYERTRQLGERRDSEPKPSPYLSWTKAALAAEIERLQSENDSKLLENSQLKKTVSSLQLDNASLKLEISNLKDSISTMSFDQLSLEKDNHKVAFLTGLSSYQVLMKVFDFADPFIQGHFNRKLNHFQEFLLAATQPL